MTNFKKAVLFLGVLSLAVFVRVRQTEEKNSYFPTKNDCEIYYYILSQNHHIVKCFIKFKVFFCVTAFKKLLTKAL